MFKNVYLLKCIIQVLTEVFQKSVPELLQVIKSVVGSKGSVVYMEYIGSGIYQAWFQSLLVPFTSSVAGPTQIHSLWPSISAAVERR